MFSLSYRPTSLSELRDNLTRLALGSGYALRPRRVAVLPAVVLSTARCWLGLERPNACLDDPAPRPLGPQGFVGICGPLDVDTLVRGYRRGMYPFSHIGRKKWWQPSERWVIAPSAIRREKDVMRMLRNHRFAITFDRDFRSVLEACARPRDGQVPLTWLTPDMMDALCRLHEAGHAHSVEARDENGELVGGLFGVATGRVFVIESQFTVARNASKAGLILLMRHLHEWGFAYADGKGRTPYLETMGFRPMPREDYVAVLAAGEVGRIHLWNVDESLDPADWPA